MKLSEVIKTIEGGSKSVYACGKNKIEYFNGNLYLTYNDVETNQVPLDGWEEVKPPRQWSEKELMLFKLLPDWAKWIATDKIGGAWMYEEKPKLSEDLYFSNSSKNRSLVLFDFLTITYEESPIYIGDLKGE